MTDTYSNDETDIPGRAEEADAPGGGDKLSQADANYRAGTPIKNCGLCTHFEGSEGANPHSCTVVDGDISPFGYCDIYVRQKNPFPQQIGKAETQIIHGMMQSPPDQSPEARAQPAVTQIGNRTYAG